MKKKYDFILIECVYEMILHYNYDVRNLADILSKGGYKVAVINYIKDNSFHENKIYDVYNIFCNTKLPQIKSYNNKIDKVIKEIQLDIKRFFFFKELFTKIRKYLEFDSIYLGSLKTDLIPILFLPNISNNYIFVWGIRAHFLKINNYSLKKIRVNYRKVLLYKLSKYRRLNFFVSNSILKKEFRDLGFNKNNIIIRPERTIKEVKYIEGNNDSYSLLSIGALRDDKNILFIIDCVCKTKGIKYILAGKAIGQLKDDLERLLKGNKISSIQRISGFIKANEYNKLFYESRFLILADEPEPTSKTNGTFVESILNSLPVIAPNFEPYNYYIKKYKIGLLYKAGSKESLMKVINESRKLQQNHFKEGIIKFQKHHILPNIANDVKNQFNKYNKFDRGKIE